VQPEDIIERARKLIDISNSLKQGDFAKCDGVRARILDFLVKFSGPNSPFLTPIEYTSSNTVLTGRNFAETLTAFIAHIEDGLVGGLSPRRQAEIDVTSDFLEQAHNLLNSKKVHPVAPAVLIGATLEEFLRNWVEDKDLSLGGKKPSLDAYATTLRAEELITKQDLKDINSWGGTRNHAAHGEWEEIGGTAKVKLMLEGVNLFMRKYSE